MTMTMTGIQNHTPMATALIARAAKEVHANNNFIQDVVGKLRIYGSISEKQFKAVVSAMDRGENPQPEIARGDAPVGRLTVDGIVLKTKLVINDFGTTLKMLVELDNKAKAWCSVTDKAQRQVEVMSKDRGDTNYAGIVDCKVSIKATWKVSDKDRSFSFGSRPIVTVLELPLASAPVASAPDKSMDAAMVLARMSDNLDLNARKVFGKEIADRFVAGESMESIAESMQKSTVIDHAPARETVVEKPAPSFMDICAQMDTMPRIGE